MCGLVAQKSIRRPWSKGELFSQLVLAGADHWSNAARLPDMLMTNISNKAAIAAFLLGLLGFYLYTSRLETEARGGELRTVLLVSQDLPAGKVLAPEHLRQVGVPTRYVDSRRVLGAEKHKVVGVALARAMKAGDSLMWSDVRDGAAHQRLAAVIAPGQRAYSLPAAANPLGAMLEAGDRVDVLLESAGSSELVLERVLVLTVGSAVGTVEADANKKMVKKDVGVTLSVEPDQAAQLLLAESKGDVRLILRNPEDQAERLSRGDEWTPDIRRGAGRLEQRKEIEHVR